MRRLGRRAALVAGALCLAVTGGLVAVQMSGDAEPAHRAPAAQSGPGGFGAWEAVPASKGGGVPQCSYAARRLLCARPGLVFAIDPADGGTLWRHAVEEAVRSEPPVVSGGLVQPEVGLLGPLEALDPATGEPVWQEEMPAYDGLRCVGDMLPAHPRRRDGHRCGQRLGASPVVAPDPRAVRAVLHLVRR